MRMLHKKPAERTDREKEILTDYFLGNPGPEFGRDKELTAKLKELHLEVDLMPKEYVASQIASATASIVVPTIPITASTNITTNHLVLRRASDWR